MSFFPESVMWNLFCHQSNEWSLVSDGFSIRFTPRFAYKIFKKQLKIDYILKKKLAVYIIGR